MGFRLWAKGRELLNAEWVNHQLLQNLDQFAALNVHSVVGLRKVLAPGRSSFGGALYQTLDCLFRSPVADNCLLEFVHAFDQLAMPNNSLTAAEFWKALSLDAACFTNHRNSSGVLRSVWGVSPINALTTYAAADRRIGIDSQAVVFHTYYITAEFDIVLKPHEKLILDRAPHLYFQFRRAVFAWTLLRYDIFNLYNDRGFLEPAGGYGSAKFGIALAEMDLIRQSGKELFTYCFGADHRTREKTLASARYNFCVDCPEPGRFCVCSDADGDKMFAEISRRATRMIATGLAMEKFPDARNLYYLPVNTDQLDPRFLEEPKRDRPLRIGHFPNHGYFKGTQYLLDAIAKLQGEGLEIELELISGRPHSEIVDAMRSLDVLVDQLISGCFGLTAVEGMALAKPVISCLRDEIEVADRGRCPIIVADPETIVNVLRSVATSDRHLLHGIGVSSRSYVLREYSIDAFACRLGKLYQDEMKLQPASRHKISRGVERSAANIALADTEWLLAASGGEIHKALAGVSPKSRFGSNSINRRQGKQAVFHNFALTLVALRQIKNRCLKLVVGPDGVTYWRRGHNHCRRVFSKSPVAVKMYRTLVKRRSE